MRVHDLSRPLETGMPVFPDDPPVSITPHTDFETDGYRVSTLHLSTHSGTHLDAPSHTEPSGATIDDVPVERFRFDAALVDCTDHDRREEIGRSVLPDPPDVDLVVFRTGWARYWGKGTYLDHPFLSPAVAEWCGEHGYSVAIDCLNPDPTPSPNAGPTEPDGFPVHRAVLGAGNLIIENLTSLENLPRRFDLHALPLPISDGDGAPARVVAVTDD